MEQITTNFSNNEPTNIEYSAYINRLLNEYEEILQNHRSAYPELYRLVELRKKQSMSANKIPKNAHQLLVLLPKLKNLYLLKN